MTSRECALAFKSAGPVGTLKAEHPPRILGGQLRTLSSAASLAAEPDVRRGEIVLELMTCTDQHARDHGLCNQASDARDRRLCACAIGFIASMQLKARSTSTGGKSNVAAVLRQAAASRVLSAQQPARERTPRQDRELLVLRQRYDLALEVAARDRAIDRSDSAVQVAAVGTRAIYEFTPAGCAVDSAPCRPSRRRRARSTSLERASGSVPWIW